MRADALRNRKRLLAVAERLLTAKGPAVEMDEIAAAAGVGVGTIYRHYATKEALVRAVLAAVFEDLIDEASAAAAAPDPGAAFFRFLGLFIERAAIKHHLAEAFSHGRGATKMEGPNAAATEAVDSKRHRFRVALEALLERAQRAGAVREDVRVPELLALVNGAFPYLRRNGADRDVHARLLKLVAGALAAHPEAVEVVATVGQAGRGTGGVRGPRRTSASPGRKGVVTRVAAKRATSSTND
jgi:AcrR family transcriptional regulator